MDRNQRYQRKSLACRLSLSARRAWIEIVRGTIAAYPILVALRKESVDRNIRNLLPCGGVFNVALRKESVDRNEAVTPTPIGIMCRSPQGERG